MFFLASSHAALASQSRNPFKRAINTLKKRKTMSDIKDVATTQAKKEEKKGRSIGKRRANALPPRFVSFVAIQ